MGTVSVMMPADAPPTAEDLVELLRYAWQQTEIVRVRFILPDPGSIHATPAKIPCERQDSPVN
jgi:hypothetical protein